MSNTICIKHGTNAPSNGVLQSYELGYVTSTGTLVIGDANKNTKSLNYLSVSDDGYINTTDNVSMLSTGECPKWHIKASEYNSAVSYGMLGSTGQACIFEYAPDSLAYYEQYVLPAPVTGLTANKTYAVLTTKGGLFTGNFTFNDKLAVKELTLNELLLLNGKVILKKGVHYGDTDPNDAEIPGEEGQIYFVLSKQGEM